MIKKNVKRYCLKIKENGDFTQMGLRLPKPAVQPFTIEIN